MSKVQTVIDAFLGGLFATVFKDEFTVLQPLSDGYLNSIVANPSAENVLAQSNAFPVEAAALLPNIESTAAKDGATMLKAFLDSQVPGLIALATTEAQAALNPTAETSTASAAGTATS